MARPAPPTLLLATTPAYPVPGRPFRLRGERISGTRGTHFRVWCTAAPPGTKLRKQLDESRSDRIALVPLLRLSDAASDGPNRAEVELTFEKGGGYVLRVEILQVGTGFTGGYESDPRGAPSEEITNSGVTTLYVASALSMQLGCGGDTATLRLYVHGDTVAQTEASVHGETTPRIDVSAGVTPRARMAAESDDVRAALGALAGELATDLVGDIASGLNDLLEQVNDHFVQSGRHFANDTDNAIPDSFVGAATAASRAATLNAIRRALAQHMRNDSGAGTGTADYHGGADWPNLPLDAASPSDALTDGIAHADTWRAYEAHRVSGVHKAADGVNKLVALPPLLALHRAFLASLAAATPATPSTSQSGAALLISQLGFKES